MTVQKIDLKSSAFDGKACLCLSTLPFQQLEEMKATFLHPNELSFLNNLSAERRKISFLSGRYAAKKALSAYLDEDDMRKIAIHHGIFEQPIVTHPKRSNVHVSISHCNDWGSAVAFPEECPMAIDIERVDDHNEKIINTQCSSEELEILSAGTLPERVSLPLLWTAKEALSKVLRCGLRMPFTILEIQNIKKDNDSFVLNFKNFPQYKAISFIIKDMACSIIAPVHVDIKLHTNI
ncbi:MAG: 4'-phosphopantetheinyl transferase superfamily protein [Candidatus Omnitrophica bacterium]|nr:4'-phosphopantetheinyl transferase superfamily protein [Candidatus Omnitrophota bacterium]